MGKRIKEYPYGTLLKYAACGHACNRDVSEFQLEDTPPEKIHITIGTRFAAMFCTNPSCHCYTIYAPSSVTLEHLIKKYKARIKCRSL